MGLLSPKTCFVMLHKRNKGSDCSLMKCEMVEFTTRKDKRCNRLKSEGRNQGDRLQQGSHLIEIGQLATGALGDKTKFGGRFEKVRRKINQQLSAIKDVTRTQLHANPLPTSANPISTILKLYHNYR